MVLRDTALQGKRQVIHCSYHLEESSSGKKTHLQQVKLYIGQRNYSKHLREPFSPVAFILNTTSTTHTEITGATLVLTMGLQ